MSEPSPRSVLPALAASAGLLLSALSAVLQPGCLERRDSEENATGEARCASCHGDPDRPGDFLARAAPPIDLLGARDTSYPGVGAHAIHLSGSETHAAIACRECHVVPERTDSPGHAEDERPAEVVFGPLASRGDRQPRYDVVSRRCSDSYCHREAEAVWTDPRDSDRACGSCHGLPPPAPHPQSEQCSVCHSPVVDSERRIAQPALHVDGTVQVEPGACTGCHGSGEDSAPPRDTLGNLAVSAIGVGAHQAHLRGGSFSRRLSCTECHSVPDRADAPGHADALPAEVSLIGIAATGSRAPRWDRTRGLCSETYCHSPSAGAASDSPSWTQLGSLGCTGCHGAPPPAPHPQIAECSRCHAATVANDDVTIIDRDRHVNGVVDVDFDRGCTSCHGGTNPAPPRDLTGGVGTALPGVGAHQAHVAGTLRSRPVPCIECHRVPVEVLDPGHVDSSPPAELVFSGAAVAFGATPVYEEGACRRTACHGGVFPDNHASGGSNVAPSWTIVDGTQAACGSCHALPPPAPHPRADLNPVCSACHENIAPDNTTFTRPELHVDGNVTFVVP
jgi:predicted CxxxxCH...CXXCH cytochrome family protein